MTTFTAARRENFETFYSPPGAPVLDNVWHTNVGLDEMGWTTDESW